MGIIEVLKKQEREKGFEEGFEEGRLEARKIVNAEKLESARTFKKMGYPVE